MKKPDTVVASIPLSQYEGTSVVVTHCGEDNNIYLSFNDGDKLVTFGPNAWRLTPHDTYKLASALSVARFHSIYDYSNSKPKMV